VEIAVMADNTCQITFAYPNHENAERSWHSVAGDPELQIRVGRYTGKILHVRFRSALARFRAGPPRFDVRGAATWCSSLPDSCNSACRRNAAIAAQILAEMPDEVRREVIKDLEELTSKS
jgi:hypothetical protein